MHIYIKKLRNDINTKRLYLLILTALLLLAVTVLLEYPSYIMVFLCFLAIVVTMRNYKATHYHYFILAFVLLIALVLARIFQLEFVANNLGIWVFLLCVCGLIVHLRELREN